jgi:hypothetical protein
MDVSQYAPGGSWEKEQIIKALSDTDAELDRNPIASVVSVMSLRARFNSQRHYEIYLFTAVDSMSEDDVREFADDTPQEFANWVRENHVKCIYNDRKKEKTQVIV